jgi:hypothetical protein
LCASLLGLPLFFKPPFLPFSLNCSLVKE